LKMQRTKVFLIDLFYYICGSLIYGTALKLFISSNSISPGGVTGIATMLSATVGLPIGLGIFILNIPILFFGYKNFGFGFIFKTAIATTVFSTVIDITDIFLNPIKTDLILSALFGGILMGLGISIIMRRGATTGGVDIIAKLLNKRRPHISIGRLILLTDAIVVGLSVLVYKNLQSALYSVITLYAASIITDIMLYGGDKGKVVYIITEKSEQIVQNLLKIVKRGVTVLDAVGGYSGKEKKMVLCTVRKYEVNAVYQVVRQNDNDAFIILTDAAEVIGQGFKR